MKLKQGLDQFLRVSIALLMGVMVLNVTWQVFSRYVLGDPSSFTDELARYSMIWLGLLGAAYVSGKNGHLAIDVFTAQLQGKKLRNLQLFIHGMVIFFGLSVLIWGGGEIWYLLANCFSKNLRPFKFRFLGFTGWYLFLGYWLFFTMDFIFQNY